MTVEYAVIDLMTRAPQVLTESRTLTALVVPYNEVTYDVVYPDGERFLPGAFSKFVKRWGSSRGKEQRRPVHLFRAHAHDRAVGVATSLTEPDDGLLGEFRVAATPYGEEILSEVADGMLTAMSVGFRTVKQRIAEDGVREIVEAELIEASILPIGAYEGAKVLAVRKPASLVIPRLPAPPRVNVGGWLG